jgi:hypothetical protein
MLANPPKGMTENSSGFSGVKRSETRSFTGYTKNWIPERSEGMDRYATIHFSLS